MPRARSPSRVATVKGGGRWRRIQNYVLPNSCFSRGGKGRMGSSPEHVSGSLRGAGRGRDGRTRHDKDTGRSCLVHPLADVVSHMFPEFEANRQIRLALVEFESESVPVSHLYLLWLMSSCALPAVETSSPFLLPVERPLPREAAGKITRPSLLTPLAATRGRGLARGGIW